MTKTRFSRTVSSNSLVILAPPDAKLDAFEGSIERSHHSHERLLAQMQQLRGRIYTEDGAISPSALSPDGRHISATDATSWHLLTMNAERKVIGCLRFRRHCATAKFQDLSLCESAMANSEIWGGKLKASVSEDLSIARKHGLQYVEVGGWALSKEIRNTTEALQSVLSIFAWSQVLGGAIGISTATERNGSASILKRLGGHSMQWDGCALPPYFDDRYQCGMEILRFDSRLPSPRYANAIQELRRRILTLDIVQAESLTQTPKMPFFLPDLLPRTWGNSLAAAC